MPRFSARLAPHLRDACADGIGGAHLRATWRRAVLVAVVCAAAGCATSRAPAPVEDRNPAARAGAPGAAPAAAGAAAASAAASPGATPAAPGAADLAAKPAAENAGKPGYYTVKPGDTLIRVGLETGQNARDIARWNNIDNPNSLEVGQVLRVAPPGVDAAATAPRGVNSARVEARPLDSKPAPAASAAAAGAAPTATAAASTAALPPPPTVPALPPVAAATPPPPVASGTREPDDELNWAWPAAGPVIGTFDEAKSKGLAIGGKAGDPVLAAADGRVVYAGSGLRGYGNLVIVKHNNTYLTAYAHNQALLVKEDQVVRRGQKIAEMGSSDAERVQLHFEIRRQGRPIDPARLLPPR